MRPRVVYDTMVFYQWAVLPAGRVHTTGRAVLEGRILLCLSPDLLAEVSGLLDRPAIRAKSAQLSPARVDAFLELVAKRGQMFDVVPNVFT